MDLRTLVDDVMELTVAPSFTDVGYRVRRSLYGWQDLAELRMDGKVVLVTGATSGLGLASELGSDTRALVADMSDLVSVRRAVEEVSATEDRLDVLINNAGALHPERAESVDGYERTFAAMVLGPFVLTHGLVPLRERAAGARVINVASGGIYLEGLHLDDLMMEREPYRGSVAYARAKRAQVLLTQAWALRLRERRIAVHSMHPGWADTPGVEASLPRFHSIMRALLRLPEQEADTTVWLAASEGAGRSTGRFWHDRRPRSIAPLPLTRASDEERDRLWAECERLTADG